MNENVAIYNPDSADFTITYDTNEDGNPLAYTLGAGQAEKFAKPIADHIATHLAKHLVFKRGIVLNFDDDYKQALQEIYV